MAGNKKYTQYAAPKSERNNLLGKLFGKNGGISLPPQMSGGTEDDVHKAVIDTAKANLTPAHQTGDGAMFGTGVDLDFSGAPNTDAVKWAKPGDPANSYAPDITSPGPTKTEGVDKDSDPGLKVADLKPAYVPKGPNTGTKSPAETSAKIIAANELGGKSSEKGSSGG